MAEEIFTYNELFQYKVTEPEDNKFVDIFADVSKLQFHDFDLKFFKLFKI